ncbi:UNKNOWN [Stylonychia lemnae]|uniref:Transmembrane protein n=1 Tax=Stylonychia lemnae TaxID=5949 RepID=A0A078B4L5_STYLE|nr:UNKNOWN [Stylonychia lemnae]|eukprot:CDW88167.1 UNKNOWN [Stylonychia lemnae]
MNIIERYYMKKASSYQTDTKYDRLEPSDIHHIKRAEFYLVAAPVATVSILYLINKLKNEVLMSQHFFYIIKSYQERFQSKYKREQDQKRAQEQAQKEQASRSSDQSDPKNLNQLYKSIEQEKQQQREKELEAVKARQDDAKKMQQMSYKRNIDPFEKKQRYTMQNSDLPGQEFSSRKLTSRRDENTVKKQEGKMNASQYMESSNQVYHESYTKPEGSIYTQALKDQNVEQYAPEGANAMDRQRQKMRGMQFGYIRESYNRLLGSTRSQRRFKLFMFAFPAIISFGVAVQNYLQVTFGIYLKYQALVDSYYLQQKETNEISFIENTQEIILKQIQSQQGSIVPTPNQQL